MSTEPRTALAALVAAFERHLEAASARRGEGDPAVAAAYAALADAFETYDEALEDAYDEVTPLGVVDDDLDVDDADGPYLGLDDDDYDEDDLDDDSDDDDEDDEDHDLDDEGDDHRR